MPSTYTSSLRFELQGTGENSGTWGAKLNNADFTLLDSAIAGVTSIDATTGSDITLTTNNGSADEARKPVLSITGTPTNNINLYIPAATKTYMVDCLSMLGTKTITIRVVGDIGTGITLAAGERVLTWTDATNVYEFDRTPVSSIAADAVGTAQIADGAVTTAKLNASVVLIPTGTVFPFAGSSVPTGYLLCYGQAVSRTTYATLFGVVSTTYGSGDGTTTFNLPDLRGRGAIGVDNMGGSTAGRITNAGSGIVGTTLGATGGNQALAAHTHTITDPGHHHTILPTSVTGGAGNASNNTNGGLVPTTTTSNATTGITATDSAGTGSSANVQPSIMLNYIIKS